MAENAGKKSVKRFSGFETPVDSMMRELERGGKVTFRDFSKKLGLSVEAVEKIGTRLDRAGIVEVHYPEMITSSPWIRLRKKIAGGEEGFPSGEKIEEYSYEIDHVPVGISIIKVKNEQRPVYALSAPVLGAYTRAFLDELKEEIVEKVPIDDADISDIKKNAEIKQRFFEATKRELGQFFRGNSSEELDIASGLMLHTMYGLGKLELLMEDNFLEEITVNSSRAPIMVYHMRHGWLKTNMRAASEEEVYNMAAQIARRVGREITTLSPILDAHLTSGDRVNATLNPISSFGNTITIRRFARRPWTITDFIGKSHTMNIEMASIIWLAMQYEMNVLIAGGTASGKTSALNAFSAFIPSYHRIISIEDVRELMLPDYLHNNWVPLTTRNPNPEGKGEVGMLELMQSSLRMRPDRIILGEIRRHKEAEVLFEAMHTGHSVYSTLHANNSKQVLERLIQPPISVPASEVASIDLVLVQYRDRKKNVRRTFELAEIESGVNTEQLSSNTVFKWQPREDDWEPMNPATKFIRNLNVYTGMTESEISKELVERATILGWMLDNNISEINQVGKVMSLFYADPVLVKKLAKANSPPKELEV